MLISMSPDIHAQSQIPLRLSLVCLVTHREGTGVESHRLSFEDSGQFASARSTHNRVLDFRYENRYCKAYVIVAAPSTQEHLAYISKQKAEIFFSDCAVWLE